MTSAEYRVREVPENASGSQAVRHRTAVSLAFLINGMFMGSWAPQIPIFAERLGLSASQMGLMILGFGIGAISIMPIVGQMIGRRGSRLPMIVFNAGLALAMPFLVLAPNVPLAIAAVLFAGFSTGGMDVAMNANAVAIEKRRKTAIMSSCHGFWSVGGFLGAVLGGLAIAAFGPVVHGLLTGLAIVAGFFVVMRLALHDAPGESAEAAGAAPVHQTASTEGIGEGGVLSGYRGAVLIGLFALFAMIPEGAAMDWSAYYLRDELGVEPASSGLAFAAFSVTMAVFRFAGDAVRDRLGAVRTIRWCSAAASAGLIVSGLAPNVWVAIAGFTLMGVGIGNMVPIIFSAAGNLKGLKPGAGLSVVTTLGYSGILIAPSIIGFIGQHFSFATVFLGLSGFLVVTLLAAPLVRVADRRG